MQPNYDFIVLIKEIAFCYGILSGSLTSGYFTSWIGWSIFDHGVSILGVLFILQTMRLMRKRKIATRFYFTINYTKLCIMILF